jgi:hypothetical protein
MQLSQRIKYSFYLALPVAAILALAIAVASADGIGILPLAAFDLVFSPLYFLVIYAASFLVAPLIVHRLPVSEQQSMSSGFERTNKPQIGNRHILIVAVGLLLVLAANLVVFFVL